MSNTCEIYETSGLELVSKLLLADKVFTVVQFAPATRVLIGEKFGLAVGEDALGKLSSALRLIGADAVVDGAIAQDAIILQKVKAVKDKKEKGGAPVIVGKGNCCKAAPMEVSARLLRKYYSAQTEKTVRIISIVCCEKAKERAKGSDVILTADELASFLLDMDFNVRLMSKSPVDTPFGVASGAAYICAAAGGKAEAVARCLIEDKSRVGIQKLAYSGLYGKGAVREANIPSAEETYKFAVVACPDEVEKIRADIENGVCAYDLVEFTCGGCISKGLENCEDKDRILKVRGLGLRYLDRAHAARSAESSPYSALLLKEWEAMVRSGEADAEIAPITEEELYVAPVIIEPLIFEEPVEEVVEIVEEAPVEEVVEIVEEAPVEEVVEIVEEAPVEEVVEIVEEAPVEEVVEIVEEAPVEEVVEIVEEAPVEEVVEIIEEAPVEEVVEIIEEAPVEEVVEIVEEAPVEEAPVVEEIPVEEETPVEEASEEEDEEENTCQWGKGKGRLSTRDRRRLKKKNKK